MSALPSEPASISKSRTSFHRELEHLQDEVLVLGSMVEKATLRSVEALRTRNLAAARAIEAEDTLLNRKRFEIEEAALLLMATQQPMASDLRRLAAIDPLGRQAGHQLAKHARSAGEHFPAKLECEVHMHLPPRPTKLIMRSTGRHASVSHWRAHDQLEGAGTSSTMAEPMPPPAHIAATPMPPPRRRSSCTSVVTIRPPVAAIG